jgi:ADP-ribosylation factor-like protein 5B
VFANKQDQQIAMNAMEIAEKMSLHSIKEHNWHIQTCCALTGEGIFEGLEWLVKNFEDNR